MVQIEVTSTLNGDFDVQAYVYSKIFMEDPTSFRETRAKVWKNAGSWKVKKSLEKFTDPDLVADDFQNQISSSSCTDTSRVEFSRRTVQ